MTEASNASGTSHTTVTILDDVDSSIGNISLLDGRNDICDFNSVYDHDTTSNSNVSQNSQCYMNSMERMCQNVAPGSETVTHRIYNYRKRRYIEYVHLRCATCEDICIDFSREMGILPNTRYLFGLREFEESASNNWCLPCEKLKPNIKYCFRMRFKVPFVDMQLHTIDANAYEYLYNQMRYDMVHECIPAIKYPLRKDNVMGFGAVTMYIDFLEQRDSIDRIESNYKRYLPRSLVKAHKLFIKGKICKTFRRLRDHHINLTNVKWHYVHELNALATDYLLETFVGIVTFIPGDILSPTNAPTTAKVYIKLDLFDTPEPGLKVARLTNTDQLEWVLISTLEDIYAIYTKSDKANSFICRLEISGMPNGYRIQFEKKGQLDTFISYLSGYMRLTTKWMVDLCVQYITPSLAELRMLRCHGPVGGAFSFAKIREQRDKCGSYIIRQCEKEYDVYYIDINTRSISEGLHPDKFKTETFKITREMSQPVTSSSAIKWKLHYNGTQETFDKLTDLAQFIPAETEHRSRIPPTEYDKPPILLICLPKHVQSKKTEMELSEVELLRKRPQIFDPPKDLRWYHNSSQDCDNGKMTKLKADWIQDGDFKDITVTLKVLKDEKDYDAFKDLAHKWCRISSHHIIKLYGLTLSMPYTIVMEYSQFGPLNELLMHNEDKISLRQLLDVVHCLVRGIYYLQENSIIHGYIRCANLLVTKFDPQSQLLEAKISDCGFRRSYRKNDLPWIPFEYHQNLNAAKKHLDVDLWAFSTTVWEIFSRGKPIENITSEKLRQNYNRFGGILEPPDDCPPLMFEVMMDGWSTDADKPFNHLQIFQRLIYVKETLNDEYFTVEDAADTPVLDKSNSFSNNDEQVVNENGFPSEFKNNFRNYFTTTSSVLEIPNGKVIFQKKIGEGHYGTVHLGEVRYNGPNNAREFVAIKTLKSLRAPQLTDDFMREIEIMESLNHPNIVKIKHWIPRPFCIIMEYLESGSFSVYLSSKKPYLTNTMLLRFALDIASGMDYLASKNIIHRDLAARNILVDGDRVKISDFGLAQRADSDGYYIAHSNREIPIKWYSPEAIKKDAKFSSQSDVWSYGVTLYEMFSRGETPNLDPNIELSQDEFLRRLDRGDRLRKPHLCPDNVYKGLMIPCWHAKPKLRPTFRQIVSILQSIINEAISNVPKSDFNNISPPLSPSLTN